MASPVPTPTSQKKLTGSWRAKSNKREPNYTVNLPKPPAYLNAEARKEYRRAGELLLAQRVITDADFAILSMYAAAWAEMIEAESELAKSSRVVMSAKGTAMPNPWLFVRNSARDGVFRYSQQLGLTPASRTKVQSLQESNSEDDEFFADNAPPPMKLVG